jgi:hypothetical protein
MAPTDFSPAGNAAIEMIKESKLTENVLLLNVVSKGENQSQVDAELGKAQTIELMVQAAWPRLKLPPLLLWVESRIEYCP